MYKNNKYNLFCYLRTCISVKSDFPFNVSWEGYILLLGRDAFTLCFLSSFFLSLCFQIWLMSVAVHWSTSDVRPMQLCYNEPVKCALEGCNLIYYACMKCTNTMKLCTTDMIQFSQVSRRHSVIHFKCNFFCGHRQNDAAV